MAKSNRCGFLFRLECNPKAKGDFQSGSLKFMYRGSPWSQGDESFRDSYLVMEQYLFLQLHPTEFTWDDNAIFHRG